MFILILMSWNSLKLGPKPIAKPIIYAIHGYQTFHDIGWQSLKSGCGFFVKDGLKYKQRTDFEMSFKDGNNEFSFAGQKQLITQPPILSQDAITDILKNLNGMFIEKLEDTLSKLRKAN